MSDINTTPKFSVKTAHLSWQNVKKIGKRPIFAYLKGSEFVCKPSSVVYGHLSRLAVADKFKRYSRRSVGRTALLTDAQSCSGWGLHCIPRYRGIGELLPRLSILTKRKALRFISVALSLKSPSPDVIRHPVLCCSDFPHRLKRRRDRITNSNL